MKKPDVFFEMYHEKIFWWRKGVVSNDFELGTGKADKTLGTQKYKLKRGEQKIW